MSTSLAAQTANWKAQTEAPQNGFGAFVRIDMPGYTLRCYSGRGRLEWDDGTGTQTWVGIPLGDLDALPGSVGVQSQTTTLILSSLESALKTEMLDYLVRGSEVYIWLFYIDGGSIVGDPWLAFAGSVDVPVFNESETVSLEVECIDALGSALRRTVSRRTDTDQQSLFTGDRFYEFASKVPLTDVKWGVPWEGRGGAGDGEGLGNGSRRNLTAPGGEYPGLF